MFYSNWVCEAFFNIFGLVRSSQLQSNLPNILKAMDLKGFTRQILLWKPSLLHLWAIWCLGALPLIRKLIVFTLQNYLKIVVNLLPWWSLFWSDIICHSLMELHNPWMRKCPAPCPYPSSEGLGPIRPIRYLCWWLKMWPHISSHQGMGVTPPPSPVA